MKEKPVLYLRSFTAFMVTAAFTVMVVTGIVLFVVPQGRIANWVDWSLLGLGKEAWGDVHILFGLIFLIAGIAHLYPFNWKPFKHYLAERVAGRIDFKRPKREAVAALAVSGLLLAGGIAAVPPFNSLYELNDWAKSAWVTSPEYEPPFGHAEELPLSSLARKTDMDLDRAMAELKARGIRFDGPRDRLDRIAHANGLSAMDVYMLIRPFERKPEMRTLAAHTPETVEADFEGTGIGRRTLAEICGNVGIDLATARARLTAAGIETADGETIRSIADRHDMGPIDVLKTMLIKGYKA